MKTKILFLILGSVLTLSIVYLTDLLTQEDTLTDRYTPEFISNEETGVSARVMEADVIYFDTDGDGEEENILLYSCQGCNAPPREVAIIDDGELVFHYEGGNMKFVPVEPGVFIINEANVPRDGRRIETAYTYKQLTNSYTSN